MKHTLTYDGNTVKIRPKLWEPIAERLSNELSYEPTGAEFAPTHQSQQWRRGKDGKPVFNKKAKWDGKVRLFKKGRGDHNHFPTGLLETALKVLRPVLKPENIHLIPEVPQKVIDPSRTLHGKTVTLKGKPITIRVRDYQREVKDALLSAPFGRAMAESPTGSGKSIIIGETIYVFPDDVVLVTVPSLSLLHQTSADLEALLGEEVGIVGDGIRKIRRVTVATPDSLNHGVKHEEIVQWLLSVGVWILDESHLSAADVYVAIGEYMPNTHHRFGVSATLRREDNAEMVFHGLVGPLTLKISPMRLIDEGWLVRPRIEMHVIQHEFEHHGPKKPKWSDVYKTCIAQNTERNNYVFEQAFRCLREERLPCLILVKDLEHGEILQDLLAQMGPTAYLQGEDKQEIREEVIAKVKTNEIPFLVASTIFDIGVDIPELRSVILAGAGNSESRAIQRVGRGLRASPGKNDVLIIDFEDRETYFLLDHSIKRKKLYNEYYPGCVTTWKNGKVLPEFGGF